MSILFYQYGSICEPDLIEGFEELGFPVDCITDEIHNKKITGKEQIALISQKLEHKSYRFVFTVNFFPAISEICNIYQIPYLSLIVDSPVMELYSHSICNPCNRIFLFDRAQYEEFVSYNPEGIFHLPLATNVKRWDKVLRQVTPEEKIRFSSTVSFIGSLYSEKCPYQRLQFPSEFIKGYCDGLINAQQKIYGYFFLENVLDDNLVTEIVNSTEDFYQFPEKSYRNDKAALAQYYFGPKITELERLDVLQSLGSHFPVDLYSGSTHTLPVNHYGRVKTHSEMPIIFHESKINLNITAKSIRSGIPQRVWDVLGCGGFLISNYQCELPELFTPGEDIVLYSSVPELLELTSYYLSHPKERMEIAQNGYDKVRNHHTYPIRLTQMLELAFHI